MNDATTREIRGPYGHAEELAMVDDPEFSATVQHWLITAPNYHPMWDQYVMVCLRLCDLPDQPPAFKKFPEATHEIMIVALDPRAGKHDQAKMTTYVTPGPAKGQMPFLLPVNVQAQVISGDEEMANLTPVLVRAITHHGFTPETSDAPEVIREAWDQLVEMNLSAMRAGKGNS